MTLSPNLQLTCKWVAQHNRPAERERGIFSRFRHIPYPPTWKPKIKRKGTVEGTYFAGKAKFSFFYRIKSIFSIANGNKGVFNEICDKKREFHFIAG